VRSFLFASLSAFFVVVSSVPSISAEPVSKPPCKTVLSKLKRWRIPLIAAAAASSALFAPEVYHDLHAQSLDRKHIGHGIYFDLKKITSLLEPENQMRLLNANENWEAITWDLVYKLHGDEHDSIELLPAPRNAEEYFCGQSDSRGMCRHKAIVLAETLNQLGIRAQLQIGKAPHQSWHMWVYLPDHDTVADPMAADMLPRNEYLAHYFPEREFPNFWIYNGNNWTLTPFEEGWFR
jgi:hypothetical protein